MTPYYEHAGITIYHGDCREILPRIEQVGCVVTDPPYGIASVWKGGAGHGWGRADSQKLERNVWDEKAPDVSSLLGFGSGQIIWGG